MRLVNYYYLDDKKEWKKFEKPIDWVSVVEQIHEVKPPFRFTFLTRPPTYEEAEKEYELDRSLVEYTDQRIYGLLDY